MPHAHRLAFLLTALLAFLSSPASAADTLLIGDSHTVGYFGNALSSALKAKRYAVAGSAAKHWGQKAFCPPGARCPFTYGYATPQGPKTDPLPTSFPGLAGLLKEVNAGRVVIALGTNDANLGCSDVSPAAKLAAMAVGSEGRACVWVGPPVYTRGPVFQTCAGNYDRFVEKLKAAVSRAGCKFVDSRQILNDQTGKPIEADRADKLHFELRLGTRWGNEVARRIQ